MTAGGEVCFAADDLDAVGGEELECGTGAEGRGAGGIHVWICVWVGEEELCAYLVGPGAAEDLVLVCDDWVARVEG